MAGSPVQPVIQATLQDTKTSITIVSTVAYGNTMEVGGLPVVALQVAGNSSSATIQPEATIDGINWTAVTSTKASDGTAANSITADGIYRVNTDGYDQLRAKISGAGHPMTITALARIVP